jgi:hypothetical protein
MELIFLFQLKKISKKARIIFAREMKISMEESLILMESPGPNSLTHRRTAKVQI